MNNQRKRLLLKNMTIRILEVGPDRVAGGGYYNKTNATMADGCSHTCTCTDTSIWPCRQ